MREFLLLLSSVPRHSLHSLGKTVTAGMRCVNGKPIVNSISSLKEKDIHGVCPPDTYYVLSAVVMLFDEQGQADTYTSGVSKKQLLHPLIPHSVKLVSQSRSESGGSYSRRHAIGIYNRIGQTGRRHYILLYHYGAHIVGSASQGFQTCVETYSKPRSLYVVDIVKNQTCGSHHPQIILRRGMRYNTLAL